MNKYGLNNFSFLVYEFYDYPKDLISNNIAFVTLTQLETEYIKSFNFDTLYNFKPEANSMIGYKHTAEAIAKMIERFQDKTNHPMFGKTHSPETKAKMSRPGSLNSRYGVKLSQETKNLISKARSKRPVFIFDLEGNLVNQFINSVQAGEWLGIHKGTVGRYIKSGKVWNNKYYIKSSLQDND